MKDLKYLMYESLLFDDDNTIRSTDIEPAISVDFIDRINEGINKIREVLGVTIMNPMEAGITIKQYRWIDHGDVDQVAEGETINLSKVTREYEGDIDIVLNKWRGKTTGETIGRVGQALAINGVDGKLIKKPQKYIKRSFFDTLKTGRGYAAGGADLQEACANLWAALQVKYEDETVTPVFFINPLDVAGYLAKAGIYSQDAFGLTYLENFMGMGTAILSNEIERGVPQATVIGNIQGYYVSASSEVGTVMGMTYDELGMIGMKHYVMDNEFSIGTLLACGVVFAVQCSEGVFKSVITGGITLAPETATVLGEDPAQFGTVAINGTKITGTLNYVSGFTGFSGDPDLQEGNYLAVKLTIPAGATNPTLEKVVNGAVVKSTPFDSDMNAVIRLTDVDLAHTYYRIGVDLDGLKAYRTYDVSGLVLEPEA